MAHASSFKARVVTAPDAAPDAASDAAPAAAAHTNLFVCKLINWSRPRTPHALHASAPFMRLLFLFAAMSG